MGCSDKGVWCMLRVSCDMGCSDKGMLRASCDMGCSDKGVLCLSLQDTKPIGVIPLFGSSAKEGKSGRERERGRGGGGG